MNLIDLTLEHTYTVGDIINSIITVIAILTLILQYRFNRRSLDLTYQPRFKFTPFPPPKRGENIWFNTDSISWTPRSCELHNPMNHIICDKDHWFNISNESEFPSIDCDVFIIHSKELEKGKVNFKKYDERVSIYPLITNIDTQYKLSPKSIDTGFYDRERPDCFYICLRYKTINRSNYFLHVYSLPYLPLENGTIETWKLNIEIYGVKNMGFKKLNGLFPNLSTSYYLSKLNKKLKKSKEQS